MINKRKFRITNNKKVLHKINKHWIVISAFALALLGSGVVATTSVHASSTTNIQNQSKVNVNAQNNRNLNTKPTQSNTATIMNQAKNMTNNLLLNASHNNDNNNQITQPQHETQPNQNSNSKLNYNLANNSIKSNDNKNNPSNPLPSRSTMMLNSARPNTTLKQNSVQTGQYAGLNYTDNNNGTIEFKNGTMQPEEASSDIGTLSQEVDFYHNAPTNIQEAHTLIFDSDINSSNISDTSSMFADNSDIQNIVLNLDTSNVSGMTNMFRSDKNLQSITFGGKFTTTDTFHNDSSDIGSDMFTNDSKLDNITINVPQISFDKKANVPKLYQVLTNLPKDNSNHYYTNVNPTNFSQQQIGQFTTNQNTAKTYTKQIDFTDNNAQSDKVPMKFNNKHITNVQNTSYSLSSSDIPNGFVLDNSSSDTIDFTNNQPINIYIHPQASGMNYQYDKDNNAITFTSGVPSSDLSKFMQNAPSIIKDASILTFNSDIYSSDVENMSDMLANDPNLTEVNFENDTGNVWGMNNLFANDPKLRNVLFGYNFSTNSAKGNSDMNGMFTNDNNLKQIINASPNVILKGDLGLSPIMTSSEASQASKASKASKASRASKNSKNSKNSINSWNSQMSKASLSLGNPLDNKPTSIPFVMINDFDNQQSDLTDGNNHQGIYLKSTSESDGTQTPYNLRPSNWSNLEQHPLAYTKAMYRNIPDAVYNPKWGQTHNSDASIHIFYTYNSDFNQTQPVQWSDMPTQYQPQNMPNRPSDDYKIIGTYDHYTGEYQKGFRGQGVIGYQLAIGVGSKNPFGNELKRFTPENIQGYIFHPSDNSFNPYHTQQFNQSDGSNGFKEHDWELTGQTNPNLPSNRDGDAYIMDYEPTAKGKQYNLDHDNLDINLNYENYRDLLRYSYTNPKTNQTSYWNDIASDSRNDKNVNSDYDHNFANFYNDVKNHGTFNNIPTSNSFPYGLYVTPSDKDNFLNQVNTSFQYGRNHITIPLTMPSTITVNYIDYGQYPQINNQSDTYNNEQNENQIVGNYTTDAEPENTPYHNDVEQHIPTGYTLLNNGYSHINKFTNGHQIINVPVIKDSHNTITYIDESNHNKPLATYQDNGEKYFSDYFLKTRFTKALNKSNPDYNNLHFLYNLPSDYRIDFNNLKTKQALNTLQHSNFDYGKVHITLPIYPVGSIEVNYMAKDNTGKYKVVKSTPITTQKTNTPFKIDDYLDNIPQGYEYNGINIGKDIFGNVVNPQFDYTKYDNYDYIINILLTKIPSRKANKSTITVNYLDKSNYNKLIAKAGSDTEYNGTDFDISKYLSNLPNGYEYSGIKVPTSDKNFDGTFFDNQNHTIDVLLIKEPSPKVAKSTITVNYLDKATNQKVAPSKSDTENVSTPFDISNYLNNLPSNYEYVGMKNANPTDNFNGTEFDYNNHTINILLTKVLHGTININYLDKATHRVIAQQKSITKPVGTPFDVSEYLKENDLPTGYEYVSMKNSTNYFEHGNQTIDIMLQKEAVPKVAKSTITINYLDKTTGQKVAPSKSNTEPVSTPFDIGEYLNNLPSDYEYVGVRNTNSNNDFNETEYDYNNHMLNVLLMKRPLPKIAKSTITVNYIDKASGKSVAKSMNDTQDVSTSFNIQDYIKNIPKGYQYKGTRNNVDYFGYDNHAVDILVSKVVPKPKPYQPSDKNHSKQPNKPVKPINPVKPKQPSKPIKPNTTQKPNKANSDNKPNIAPVPQIPSATNNSQNRPKIQPTTNSIQKQNSKKVPVHKSRRMFELALTDRFGHIIKRLGMYKSQNEQINALNKYINHVPKGYQFRWLHYDKHNHLASMVVAKNHNEHKIPTKFMFMSNKSMKQEIRHDYKKIIKQSKWTTQSVNNQKVLMNFKYHHNIMNTVVLTTMHNIPKVLKFNHHKYSVISIMRIGSGKYLVVRQLLGISHINNNHINNLSIKNKVNYNYGKNNEVFNKKNYQNIYGKQFFSSRNNSIKLFNQKAKNIKANQTKMNKTKKLPQTNENNSEVMQMFGLILLVLSFGFVALDLKKRKQTKKINLNI